MQRRENWVTGKRKPGVPSSSRQLRSMPTDARGPIDQSTCERHRPVYRHWLLLEARAVEHCETNEIYGFPLENRAHFRYVSKRSRDRTSIPRNEQSALPWVTLLRYDRNRAHDSQTRASMFKWTRRIAFYFLCSSTKADLAESSLAKLNRTTDS